MRFVCLLGCALTTILLGCSTYPWDYEAQLIREEQERINQAKPIVQEMADVLAPKLLELPPGELQYQLRKLGVDPNAIKYYAEARRRIMSGIPGESFERLDLDMFRIGTDADKQNEEYMTKCPGAWADYLLARQVKEIRINEDIIRAKDELRKVGGGREQEDSIVVGLDPLSVRTRTHLSWPEPDDPYAEWQQTELKKIWLKLAAVRRALEPLAFPGRKMDLEIP